MEELLVCPDWLLRRGQASHCECIARVADSNCVAKGVGGSIANGRNRFGNGTSHLKEVVAEANYMTRVIEDVLTLVGESTTNNLPVKRLV
jgi:hypothetical protein